MINLKYLYLEGLKNTCFPLTCRIEFERSHSVLAPLSKFVVVIFLFFIFFFFAVRTFSKVYIHFPEKDWGR